MLDILLPQTPSRPPPAPIEPKPPPIVSYLVWIVHWWNAGGIHRQGAIAVAVGFVLVGVFSLYECSAKYRPSSSASVGPAGPSSTILDPSPQTSGTEAVSKTTVPAPSIPTAFAAPQHKSHADAVESLRIACDLLAHVRFSAEDSNRSAKALVDLAKLGEEILTKTAQGDMVDTASLDAFRRDFLVLRPELAKVREAFARIHLLIAESAENYELLGPLHPDLADLDQDFIRSLKVLEDFEQLGTAAKPVRPSTNVYYGNLLAMYVRNARQSFTVILAKLEAPPVKTAAPEPAKQEPARETLSELEKKVHAFDLYEKALATHRAGKFQDAATMYRQVIADDPSLADAYLNLGLIIAGQGEKEEARKMMEAAIRVEPRLARGHWMLGLMDADKNDIPSAVSKVRQAVTLSPSTILYRLSLAKFLAAQRSHREAAEAYRDAVALEPANWEANWGYAEELWFDDQNDNALKAYENCLGLKPDDVGCLSRIAQVAWAKGDRARGLAAIDRAIGKNPKNGDLLRQRADFQRSSEEWQKAAADYHAALDLDANDADALDGLARAENAQGRNKAAGELCRRAIAARPDFVSAKLLLSVVLMAEKKYPEAEEFLLAAIRSHPAVPEFSMNLANCYSEMGQPDSAFSVLRRAVVDFPKSAQLLRMLAAEQQNRGAKAEAAKLYVASIAADPTNVTARAGYAELLVSLKRLDEAVEQYRELMKLAPGNEKYRTALESAQKKIRR